MAAFVGVAATGVAIARAERERRAYTPEQVRDRLHERVAEVDRAARGPAGDPGPVSAPSRGPVGAVRAGLTRLRTRVGRLRPVAGTGHRTRESREGDSGAA
ncbi:hypothetical protein [Nocardiopsis sp. NPDC058789]|uniref:Uncharacterized protein n=1 Tax=Nocardiopsis eucommiae TaxID=2831970 RepID=A0A975QMC7_9ACTN|nr:hypothetical protein KGD82_12330 [Nocardiopsis eucommiae]